MYSKNDYRYYLEHRLLVSDDYLAHYGVMGMKWGVRHDERRAALVSKRDANNVKITKYQNKLNTVSAQKRAAKAAKYQHKVDKLQRKASKAEKRLAQGKNISNKQMKKIMRYETYKAKVAKNSSKNDKYQMKISQLQTKNAKLDKKINKMDNPSRSGARAYQKALNKYDIREAGYRHSSDAINGPFKVGSQQRRDAANKKIQEKRISNQKDLDMTLKDAKARGYDISSKDTWRNVYGVPGALTGQFVYYKGTKYKVNKPKKKG